MGIVLWIVLGLVAGSLARFIMPGPDPLGLVGTILLGVGGAVLGGAIGTFTGGAVTGFDFRSLIMAVIGSLVLLICLRSYAMRGGEVAVHKR
jgi:uncharacterized membrane protein YeaQ/YmgE (transglycosylase-associated protein family)